jgi:hypothetical protein
MEALAPMGHQTAAKSPSAIKPPSLCGALMVETRTLRCHSSARGEPCSKASRYNLVLGRLVLR